MQKPFAPAILIFPRLFDTAGKELVGRLVANRSFLQGLIRHGGLATLHGYAPLAGTGEACEQLARCLGAAMPVSIIKGFRLDQLADIGGLVVPDPNLNAFARHRSFVGHRAYFLMGLTHTLAEIPAIALLQELATAPVQPWDALVCTSRAALAMVHEILRVEEARLAERLGATGFPRPLLPVIPLGVDAASFAPREEWRMAWRERLGIGTEEVAALYVGRLSQHVKAHPLPMLAALHEPSRIACI
jgi:alpha-maltose-1-phosphate synthase